MYMLQIQWNLPQTTIDNIEDVGYQKAFAQAGESNGDIRKKVEQNQNQTKPDPPKKYHQP